MILNSLSGPNRKIVKIIKPFLKRFMKNFTQEFIDYWLKIFPQNTNTNKVDDEVSLQLRKIINILTLCWDSPEEFINNICKSNDVEECIRQNEFVKKKGVQKNETRLLNSLAIREARIFFFVYLYLMFVKVNFDMKPDAKKEYYERVWGCVTKFLKLFQDSLNPNTYFWIIEIFILISEKFTMGDMIEDVYGEYSRLLNTTLFNISKLASGQTQIDFFTQEERDKWVFPLPPTLYGFFMEFKDQTNQLNEQRNALKKEIVKIDTKDRLVIERRLRFQAFAILKAFIGSQFMFVRRDSTKTDRMTVRTRAFIDNLFPLMMIRQYEALLYVECSSELLSLMLKDRGFLVRELKKEIFEIFNMDEFFHCTINTLKYWREIMDITVSNCRDDILGDYLNK